MLVALVLWVAAASSSRTLLSSRASDHVPKHNERRLLSRRASDHVPKHNERRLKKKDKKKDKPTILNV